MVFEETVISRKLASCVRGQGFLSFFLFLGCGSLVAQEHSADCNLQFVCAVRSFLHLPWTDCRFGGYGDLCAQFEQCGQQTFFLSRALSVHQCSSVSFCATGRSESFGVTCFARFSLPFLHPIFRLRPTRNILAFLKAALSKACVGCQRVHAESSVASGPLLC